MAELFKNNRFDIAASAGRMIHANDSVRQRTGLDMEIMEYVGRATSALPASSGDTAPGTRRAES